MRSPRKRGSSPSGLRARAPLTGLSFAAIALTCAPAAVVAPDCDHVGGPVVLDDHLEETSGVAVGLRDPEVMWTHNDGHSRLFAIDRAGAVVGMAGVRPRLRDWEDLEVGRCDAHGSCLYLADTGDNAERRPAGDIRIVRIPEPELIEGSLRVPLAGAPHAPPPAPGGRSPVDVNVDVGVGIELTGEVFPMRLPEGPRDVEALFVLPGERIYLITKGRRHPVTVYRYPGPLRPDTVTLAEVQRLSAERARLPDQVTGAAASPDGARVGVRTYTTLEIFGVVGDSLRRVEDGVVGLRQLGEAQGEAVGLGPRGLVALTSEGGLFGGAPSMNVLRCRGVSGFGS